MEKDLLRETLKQFNLRAVAEETGINYSTLRNYVSGHRKITSDRKEKVVEYIKNLSQKIY